MVAPVARIEWFVYICDKAALLLSSDMKTVTFFSPTGSLQYRVSSILKKLARGLCHNLLFSG
jgi:hypothetical protein